MPESSPGSAALGSLRGSLRQLGLALGVLDDCVTTLAREEAGKMALMQVELLAAIRSTIGVLEGTRRHFQSRELGALRVELQRLLRRWDAEEEEFSSTPGESGG